MANVIKVYFQFPKIIQFFPLIVLFSNFLKFYLIYRLKCCEKKKRNDYSYNFKVNL